MLQSKTTYTVLAIFLTLLVSGCTDAVMTEDGAASTVPTAAIDPDEATVAIDNGQKGEVVNVGLVSWHDLPFQTVKHQAYDYSCGSAAVATLMTYAYDMPTTEKDVFQGMFEHGDQDKIRHEGFSMLDMSRYLNEQGLNAQGYKIEVETIAKYKVPLIALVNNKGYNHFVVIKTMDSGRILVGDPNTGNTEYSLDGFSQIWSGIALIVTNKASQAHTAYDNQKEWRFARARAPLRDGNDAGGDTAELAPMSWQIAPVSSGILPATMVGTAASTAGGVR